MTENFDSYNAPQFFDFNKDLQREDNIDAYFEVDHETLEDPSEDPLKCRYSEEVQEEEYMEFYSPMQATPGSNYECRMKGREELRRSMSVGDLYCVYTRDTYREHREDEDVSKAAAGLCLSDSQKQSSKNKSVSNLRKVDSKASLNLNKDKAGPTRISAPRLTKVVSKDSLNRLAQPKHYSSAQNLNESNYVSMAEAVRKFQNGTPTRFRSKPKLENINGVFGKLGLTVPQSPALMTKGRHRPVTAVSRQEQEMLEYEEAQKFKIKARPLNKKILQGPVKPLVPVTKKPTTIVEPFKITAPPPPKVALPPKQNNFEFHANPVPNSIHEAPKLKEVHRIKITKPQTPTFMKRYVKEPLKAHSQASLEEHKPPAKTGNTVPVPFSFETRDQFLQKKKEERIKKVLEEEKKAREFHARPIPKGILTKNSSSQRSDSANNMRPNGISKSDECLSNQFKARPPTVLYKKPFEPKRDEQHLIEITEFQLNTELRAKEREEFEQFKREKEERIALAKQMEEQKRLRQEEEEVARIRREAEYKAQPVKKYKEVKIQPSGKVTDPISPKFHVIKCKSKANKENEN